MRLLDGTPRGDEATPRALRTLPLTAPDPYFSRRTQLSASIQVQVDDAIRTTCPECGAIGDSTNLVLDVALGPISDHVHVLLIGPGSSMESVIDRVKRTMSSEALRTAQGNIAEAARLLGMKYTTFHALVQRLGLT